ncbi:MAG: DUF5668 domain-containing protein [Candidatus Zixiibacteriota bacterium]
MHIGRIRNGAILIAVGIVLLLNTTGRLSWSVWAGIFSLWPLVLVAVGIELLFKRTHLSFLAILSPLLFIATILGPALFFESDFVGPHHTGETYFWSQNQDSTLAKVKAIIEIRDGDLKLSSGRGKLASAELDYFREKPFATYRRLSSDSSATVEITDGERIQTEWIWSRGWYWGEYGKKDWKVTLTDRVPISLQVHAKASRADLNLSDLQVKDFDLELKASNVDVRIGDLSNEITGTIVTKACKLSIFLPEDMGLRIQNHTNLSSTSFSWLSLKEIDGQYQTPDFERAARKLTLYLDGSLTKLRISSYKSPEGI